MGIVQMLERELAQCDGASRADVCRRIDLLNQLAWELSDTDAKRAFALSEAALALARPSGHGEPPYLAGIAYSLRTKGYLNMRLGDYPSGLSQLLEAQGLCEAVQADDGLADVFDGIAAVYYQIGSFPEALSSIYRQLAAAQRSGDRRRIANAYNNLAVVYYAMGDYGRAAETFTQNLALAVEIDYERIETLSCLNLVQIYLPAGDFEQAHAHALRGLHVAQRAGYALFEVYAYNLIGKAWLKLGDPPQAISSLEQALALSHKIESNVTESLILLNLGEAYRVIEQPEQALIYLHQSVAAAQAMDAKGELFRAHLLLSELYEQQGDTAQALAHFKQYHALNEQVLGEKADQRLKVLHVAYDTETAKKEAEILQLRTVELQHEIAEHTRAKRQLERQIAFIRALSACSQALLAATFDATDIRHLLDAALRPLIAPAQASSLYLYRNVDDPTLGSCFCLVVNVSPSGIPSSSMSPKAVSRYRELLAQTQAGLPAVSDDPEAICFPWSTAPAAVARPLAAGAPVGGLVRELYAATPVWQKFLLHDLHVVSMQFFPIHIGGKFWGFVGFDDRVNERIWAEDEILLLGTAAELLANTFRRWQAEENLRTANDQLEQQVRQRTRELSDTVVLLQSEIAERERAEAAIRDLVATLEHRVAARTEELATFFDLTLLAGQAEHLSDVLVQVLPRIIDVTRSQAIGIHLLDDDRAGLHLAAQINLPADRHAPVPRRAVPPGFRRWMAQPSDPLLTIDLPSLTTIPVALCVPGFQTYLGAQIRIGTRVEGTLSCYRDSNRGFGLDEVALVTALAEQIGMMLATQRLRQSAQTIAVVEERQRLARDLHDSVTQSLYSLSLFSRAGREAADDGDAARLQLSLTELERNTLHALREMRLLLYELRPADLQQEGLVRAIQLRLNTVERRTGLELSVRLDELPGLSPRSEVELYHIIVEALNNVVKHATATCVTLQLNRHGGQVRLWISDNGQGFDPQQSGGGMGLRNIQERVAQLNGQLTLASAPGSGTQIEAIIPYKVERSR
ncbi:MAG: tetratricopeptide repeat protein [Chloroflexales bacterium]|nr:tetratricopeptide repeat protein [Chloroflexales bacterium]